MAEPIDIELFGKSGKPVSADAQLIHLLLASSFVPVISPVAASAVAATREALNVNGDDAAAVIAAALGAELWLLADVSGVLDENRQVIGELDQGSVDALVAAGTVKWDERIILKPEDKVSGSGVLASLEDRTELTVRNLAILMIILSDNTATNLILDRIGADAVNDYLDTIGLVKTRANRKVRGDGTKLAAPSGWSKAGLIEDNKRFGLGVSTPREMVRLLALLDEGKIISPEASKDILEILKMQQDNSGIRRHTPDDVPVANKSGALDALRSDVGIVYTKTGPVALAITIDDMPEIDYSRDNPGERLIWQITSAILDGLSTR